jgi:hypothetical protein
MPHQAAVGPPQPAEPSPALTRAAAGVEIRGEPQPTDQKGQSGSKPGGPTQQQRNDQPQQPADAPGSSIVAAAASQGGDFSLIPGSRSKPVGTMGKPPG